MCSDVCVCVYVCCGANVLLKLARAEEYSMAFLARLAHFKVSELVLLDTPILTSLAKLASL